MIRMWWFADRIELGVLDLHLGDGGKVESELLVADIYFDRAVHLSAALLMQLSEVHLLREVHVCAVSHVD